MNMYFKVVCLSVVAAVVPLAGSLPASAQLPAEPLQGGASLGGRYVDPLSVFTQAAPELDQVRNSVFTSDLTTFLQDLYKEAAENIIIDPLIQTTFCVRFHNSSYRQMLPYIFKVYRIEMRQLEEHVYVITRRTPPPPAETSQPAALPDPSALPAPALPAPAPAEPAAQPAPALQPQSAAPLVQAEAGEAEFQIRLMAEPQDRDHIEVDYIALDTAAGRVHLPMHRTILCTGKDVVAATLVQDSANAPAVNLELTPDAGERLRRATGGNLGKQMALVYKGALVAAPIIRDEVAQNVMVSGSGGDWPEMAKLMVENLGKH